MASVKIRNRSGQWIDLVLDNVTSDSSHQALSAKQGKLLSQNKADKSTTLSGYGILDAYTKTEVDALVSAVFRYKGVKDTVADVEAIQNPSVGDVWFVTADGSEYAWNGTIWEKLGPVIDLSHFITQISIAGIMLDVNSTTITTAQLIQALDIYTKSEVYNKTEVDNQLSTKVPTTRKINNKTLSQDITLDKSDVGLSNVDNTRDTDKPISTAQQTALDSKLNKNQGTTNTGKFMKVGSNGELVPDNAYQKPANGIPASDLASAVTDSLALADSAYQKPQTGIPASDMAAGVIPDISGKADKVQNAVQGNFAGLDSNGNLTDSGHKHSDYAEKADTVLSTTLSRGRKSGSTVGTGSSAFGDDVVASGEYSHAEGNKTTANHKAQHVFGEYNEEDDSSASSSSRGNFVEIVGNGTGSSAKSNARTLDWDGNERLKGDIYVNCNSDGSGGTKLDPIVFATDSEIQDIIDDWEVSA